MDLLEKMKNRKKILLTCLIKDDTEYDSVQQMLETFMPYMDGLLVGFTGKHAKLDKLINTYSGTSIEITPKTAPECFCGKTFISFAAARNRIFTKAEELQKIKNYDWWSWADSDDILVSGDQLQNVALLAQEKKIDAVFFPYWYAINLQEDGSFTKKDVQIDHLRERLLRPGVFKWTSNLHEVCVPRDGHYQPVNSEYPFDEKAGTTCVWAHITTEARMLKAVDRNITILEAQRKEEVAKGQNDPRTIFYLAKSYYDQGTKDKLQLSELLLQEYLELSGWAEERASAWEYLGNIRLKQGNPKDAIDCYLGSLKEFGNRHMTIIQLSKCYSLLENFEQSDFWLDVVMKMEEPRTRTTIGNPLEVNFAIASLKLQQALRQNNLKEAMKWAKTRHAIAETEDDKDLMEGFEELNQRNEAAKNVFLYAKWLKNSGHRQNIHKLLETLPLELGRELFAHQLANEVAEPRVWGEKEICYYASFGAEHFEEISPLTVEAGMGGSETAVVELAKRWVKAGYKVTVYTDVRDHAGEYEGVTYKNYFEINWNDTFNFLILWRSPHLLDRDIKAKRIFMDLHDMTSYIDWTEERMAKVDKVFFKSNYHRKMLHRLPDSKAVVISNGINI